MDYREQTFKTKFDSAAQHLGVDATGIVSLKLRENVGSHHEYQDLVECLGREFGLQCSKLNAPLQGQGFLIDDGRTKVILVEHETGLEILYIAGSIASLVQLIPIVLQAWRALREREPKRHAPHFHNVEIRRLDKQGHLIEEHVHDRLLLPGSGSFQVSPTIAVLIESEMKTLARQLESLTSRVEALEKRISSRAKPSRKKKNASKEVRSRKQ